jgi:LmbE family N-acetylglucosaminyl deacetylase
MLGVSDIWQQRNIKLPGGQFVRISNPKDNPHVSLIFLHLPDGNLRGQGFHQRQNQSLAKLEAGQTKHLQSVDGQSSYDVQQLTAALTALMHTYLPTEIHTQSSANGEIISDHSDHVATGRFTTRAYQLYEQEQFGGAVTVPLLYYMGYPGRELAPNVDGQDLAEKQAAFMMYAKHDPDVCQTVAMCNQTPTYGSYLLRQYTRPQ